MDDSNSIPLNEYLKLKRGKKLTEEDAKIIFK